MVDTCDASELPAAKISKYMAAGLQKSPPHSVARQDSEFRLTILAGYVDKADLRRLWVVW